MSAAPASTARDWPEYVFKHALVRDVAYASLPAARRVRAHAGASSWIETVAGDRLEEVIELIAFHDVEAAGEPGAWHDDAEYDRIRSRAYTHALQAASSARRRSAVDSALRLDGQAPRLSSGQRERIGSLTALGDDCRAGFRGDDGRHHYEQALQLARDNAVLAAERARLCAKLASMMAMAPGSFRVSPDPIEVDRLAAEGLAAAGNDEVSPAQPRVCSFRGHPGSGGHRPTGRWSPVDGVGDRITSLEDRLYIAVTGPDLGVRVAVRRRD